MLQEALSPASRINQARPDAVLVAIDHHGLPAGPTAGDAEAAQAAIAASLAHFEAIRGGIRANGNAACILQTHSRARWSRCSAISISPCRARRET